MCLLAVLFRVRPGAPLIVAANRDEFLARPTTAMTTLSERAPRILGGRDDLAGGTWLAVNEHGVVAGLTNRPNPNPDRTRRSRGELPLALARHRDATSAVEAFRRDFRPSDYNPGWLLVGDRDALYTIDMTGGEEPGVTALAPGIHALENRPLADDSPKASKVRAAAAAALAGPDLYAGLRAMLADHEIPHGATGPFPLRETQAVCVHAGPYGTRSSALIVVPDAGLPGYSYTDGPPCTARWRDATPLFAP
jgi:uncharacterized protein with NRDE domain